MNGIARVSLNESRDASFFADCYSTYPLRFQQCHSTVSTVSMMMMIGFGGGLVSGDSITIQWIIDEGCILVVRTPGSTKVFPAKNASNLSNTCIQRITSYIAPNGLLVYIPDALTCYKNSKIHQQQSIYLENKQSSCIIVDMYTSGRLNKDEYWTANEIRNQIEIYREGEIQFLERLVLENDEEDKSMEKMIRSPVFGMLILCGPRTQALRSQISACEERETFTNWHKRRKTEERRNMHVASDGLEKPPLVSIANLEDRQMVIMRFTCSSIQSAYTLLQQTFAKTSLEKEIGLTPYSDRVP